MLNYECEIISNGVSSAGFECGSAIVKIFQWYTAPIQDIHWIKFTNFCGSAGKKLWHVIS